MVGFLVASLLGSIVLSPGGSDEFLQTWIFLPWVRVVGGSGLSNLLPPGEQVHWPILWTHGLIHMGPQGLTGHARV